MALALPQGMQDTDDVATTQVAAGAVVHLPGGILTGCGQPMWAMHRVASGHMATLSCRWCPTCWPRVAAAASSGWAQMLALAHLPFPDLNSSRGFGFLNARTYPGVGQPTNGS